MFLDLSQLKAVIFDLDGTLFDSAAANVAFYNYILEELGRPPMSAESEICVHYMSMQDSLRQILGDDPKAHLAAREVFKKMEFSRFVGLLIPFDGVRKAIETLKTAGLGIGLATNRLSTTPLVLDHFGIGDLFDTVVTPADAGAPKPDPRMMELTLKRMQVFASQAVYVGDSQVDADLCLATGVPLLAFRSPELAAWAHAEHYHQLPGLLGVV